jgi:amidase
VSTFITRCDTGGDGVRLAVKDVIDVAGLPTTAGCRAVADGAEAATADAACLAGARAAGARIVGKANLHELALGATGVNPWFGTPVNPLDPALIPGGSSSGSAVAVADGEADVAFGTDTGGSVRIPAACCGTTALKTTWGRIPLDGVWPTAPSFDTVGPLARDVSGLVRGMELLEPGFAVPEWAPGRVARLRVWGDPAIDAAVDAALAATGWAVHDLELRGWDASWAGAPVLAAESWATDRHLVERWPERISPVIKSRLYWGRDIDRADVATAHLALARWRAKLAQVFDAYDLLALPSMAVFPPTLRVEEDVELAHNTMPVNLGGVPALSMPVPTPGSRVPASLQLIGPWLAEAQLLAAGRVVEASQGGPATR